MMDAASQATPNGRSRLHEFSLSEKVQAFTNLHTVWSPGLSSAELILVGWLIGNTVGRGKRSGVYSHQQLVEGVPRADGLGMWTAGTGLAIATVRRAIASAREKGVIHTSQEARGTRYAVVLSWSPATGEAEETNVVALNLPRAARRAARPAVSDVKATHDQGDNAEWGDHSDQGRVINLITEGAHSDHPSIEEPTRGLTNQGKNPEHDASRRLPLPKVRTRVRPVSTVPSQDEQRSYPGHVLPSPRCAAPPPADEPDEAPRFDPRSNVADAIAQATERRAERLAAARKRTDTNALFVTWLAACTETNPGIGCAPWTQKSAGMLKKAIKAHWPLHWEGRLHEFLEWSVREWNVILGAKLSWMRNEPPPEFPEITFLARFLPKFQQAFAEREELRWRGTLPEIKQAAIALARRRRIPEEVAMAEVREQAAAERNRAANEKIAAQARKDRDDAFRAAERARRATRFTRDNPHPRAHENFAPKPGPITEEPDWEAMSKIEFKFDESKIQ